MTDPITLRELMEAHRAAHEREHTQHEKEHERDHHATEQAITVAVAALDKRLDSMNEFRAALTSQQATFVRREMLDQYRSEQDKKHDEQAAQINELRRNHATEQGRILGISAAFGVVVIIISIALRFL